MDAGHTGNGGVGGKTIAGCLIDVHFYRRINGVSVRVDLRHIRNDRIFNAGMWCVFQWGNSRHEACSPLALRAAACILMSGLRLSVLSTPQSITIWRLCCFEAFVFSLPLV